MTLLRLVVINNREVFAQSDGPLYAQFGVVPKQGNHSCPGTWRASCLILSYYWLLPES